MIIKKGKRPIQLIVGTSSQNRIRVNKTISIIPPPRFDQEAVVTSLGSRDFSGEGDLEDSAINFNNS